MASEFKDQLALLQELQAIDLDLHSLKIKLDVLPSRIADKRQEYESISEQIGALKTELDETEKNRRSDEQELRQPAVQRRLCRPAAATSSRA